MWKLIKCDAAVKHLSRGGSRGPVGPRFSPSPTHLLQLVGLGLVLVPVGVLPVGQAERPHRQDAVHVVSDPRVRLVLAARQKTRDRVLLGAEGVKGQPGNCAMMGGKAAQNRSSKKVAIWFCFG